MKPVVSSIVALALAIAPLTALAATSPKAHAAKPAMVKVVKHKKSAHAIDKIEKASKAEKVEKVADATDKHGKKIARVKHGKKVALKHVVHHATGVDLGGAGHSEPKIERASSHAPATITPVSLTTKSHVKVQPAKEMPRLPNPNAASPSKHGAEKGVKKPAPKKAEAADDGAPSRDEELAELVARIRGASAAGDEPADPKPSSKRSPAKAKPAPEPICLKDPVEIIRGPEVDKFPLAKCDGTPAPLAIERLSIAIRPGGAARPTATAAELSKKEGELAHGIKRVDPGLVERLQAIIEHFSKNAPAKIDVISGYRPTSIGSMHASGRAIDFRLEGVKNEEVVGFCKTLTDTGCGYYPNSSFVHVDVRDSGAGHVSWIDASGPGESPRYVTTWPPQPVALRTTSLQKLEPLPAEAGEASTPSLDREATPEPSDEHPSEASGDTAEESP